ncbi:MAG: InlB B-repeat-containing protein [Eubacterium sp.]|nr:InlB B-repeat-containing protein [Eubacterium sp.]
MDVSDQGTGVDYVGIQLVFPHGNSTYFYDIGYSTNSPVYSGHIVITKDITNDEQDFYNPRPGTYSISSVTVTDCANNRRIYNTGKENYSGGVFEDEHGTYFTDENDSSQKCYFTDGHRFTVVRSNQAEPVLTSFEIVDGLTVEKGSAITVRLGIQNLQNLKRVYVMFNGPDLFENDIEASSRWTKVNDNTILLRIPVTEAVPAGNYYLSHIILCDSYGEMFYIESAYEGTFALNYESYYVPVAVKDRNITVKSDGDENPPVIKGFHIDTPTVIRPGIIKVTVDVSDDTGIAFAGCQLCKEGDTSSWIYSDEQNFNEKETDRSVTFKLPVGSGGDPGKFYISNMVFKDFSGNKTTYNTRYSNGSPGKNEYGNYFLHSDECDYEIEYPSLIETRDEFDYAFEAGLNNPSLESMLAEMPEGQAAKVNLEYDNRLAPANLFRLIQGKDKKIVFGHGEYQWIFDGKKITNPKDVDLTISTILESGVPYGVEDTIILINFANNGLLPGEATVRFKSDVLYDMHELKGSLYLYYVQPNTEELTFQENSDISYYIDGSDHWCSFNITHNSSYIAAGQQLNTTKNIKGKKFTFKYNANGGKASAKSKKVTGGKTFGKLASASRKGYKFDGWYTEKTGGTKVTKSTVVKYIVKTLYAHWTIINYKLSYRFNGGALAEGSSNPATYTVTDTVTFTAPEKTGYRFAGWYKDKKLKKKLSSIKAGSTGNKTLYAKWSANTYTLTFAGNGASKGSMKKQSFTYGSKAKALSSCRFSRTGYSFQGWALSEDGPVLYKNKQKVKNLTSVHKENIRLYAVWKINTYKITYKYNGGKKVDEADNPASYTVLDEVILKDPVREGYTFTGWYKDKKFKKKASSVIGAGSTGNRTFYARWKKAPAN